METVNNNTPMCLQCAYSSLYYWIHDKDCMLNGVLHSSMPVDPPSCYLSALCYDRTCQVCILMYVIRSCILIFFVFVLLFISYILDWNKNYKLIYQRVKFMTQSWRVLCRVCQFFNFQNRTRIQESMIIFLTSSRNWNRDPTSPILIYCESAIIWVNPVGTGPFINFFKVEF